MAKSSTPSYPSIADPFIGLFRNRWKWQAWQVILLLIVLSAVIFFGVGSFASASYTGPGRTISSIDNASFMLIWLLAFLPLTWGVYFWQVEAIYNLVVSLRNEEVFGRPNADSSQKVADEVSRLIQRLAQPWVYGSVLALIIVFWAYEYMYGWPQQFQTSGPQYWWEVRWYLPFHITTWTMGLYALLMLAFRQVLIVHGLSGIMGKHDVAVRPLDPDGVGGFGSVGDFIQTSILFVIGIGVLAAFYAIEVYLAGGNILQRGDVLAFFVIYIILAPICLTVPTTYTQRAMLRAREKVLEPLAHQYQDALDEARSKIGGHITTEEVEQLNQRLDALQKHRELIMQTFPTSPLTVVALRNFSLTALLPLVSGTISIVLQLIK
jgi:hypothetical protein